jgi:hypothetical protein
MDRIDRIKKKRFFFILSILSILFESSFSQHVTFILSVRRAAEACEGYAEGAAEEVAEGGS